MKKMLGIVGCVFFAVVLIMGAGGSYGSSDKAVSWQKEYPEITLGVITSENESDRILRYKPVRAYLEKTLGTKITWRTATDYAGIIEGVKSKKIELAYFGPASYAKCWIVTKGQVEPLVGEMDPEGTFGYHSVVIVQKDSTYKTIKDLKGVKFAFADPNSTSGHQAPRFFLGEDGYDADKFFGSVTFSGSHENSVMGLLNGTYDAVATWWRNEGYSNPTRMEIKKMIEPGQWRIVWKSPKLPESPWAMPTYLPRQMREDVKSALMKMKDADPAAWTALTTGKSGGFKEVTHEEYAPIVRMIEANLKERSGS